MLALRSALEDERLLLDVEADDLPALFPRALELLVERGILSQGDVGEVERALVEREEQAPTAIGHAVAVPHAYLERLSQQSIVVARLRRPVNLGAPDGIPTRFVFLLLGPTSAVTAHLETLMSIARLMSDDAFRYEATKAATAEELLAAFDAFEERTEAKVEAPTEEEEPEGLSFTGQLFGGLRDDVRRRLPHLPSDFRDGFHPKVLASVLFLVFACLAPAVTFGGVMAVGTEGYMGAVEMLIASAICGVVFALFSGQPLIILGGTGPLLVFTVILYALCQDLGAPFLATYAYVGLWAALILLVIAATDVSALMRHFTRFTDEIFAALISFIFVVDALDAIVDIFAEAYSSPHASHDRAFLSLILAFGTFFVALNLSRFRRSRYLMPPVREFLADFGPTIALALMTGVAVFYRGHVSLDMLDAPSVFGTTRDDRGWFQNPFSADLPLTVLVGGPFAALFAAILIYLDQNITSRIINSPDNRLKKGPAYHQDLAVVAVLTGVCSVFGLPWLVAATVRSLNHLRSLATFEETIAAGETRERIVHVRENRVSALVIHLLIGVSLLALPILKMIPMAVLYGLFLFMGVASMKGNQFFERLALWPMDPSLYPASHYIRRVPRNIIHRFTSLQLVALSVLWVVKAGPPMVAIFFPLVIAVLAPLRLWVGRFFESEHLETLDADALPEEEADEWV